MGNRGGFKKAAGCTGLLLLVLAAAACSATVFRDDAAAGRFQKDGVLEFFSGTGDPHAGPLARIDIEIADTPGARARGLMWRRLPDDTAGMLFLYEKPGRRVFWMKNTPMSLDIIFVGEDGLIGSIAAGTTPMSESRYRSKGPALWVVEVPAGFCRRHGVSPGSRVRWWRN